MYFSRMSVHGDLPKIRKSKTGVTEDIPGELAGQASRDSTDFTALEDNVSPGVADHALDISTTPPTQPSASAAFKDCTESSVNHCEVRSKIISQSLWCFIWCFNQCFVSGSASICSAVIKKLQIFHASLDRDLNPKTKIHFFYLNPVSYRFCIFVSKNIKKAIQE